MTWRRSEVLIALAVINAVAVLAACRSDGGPSTFQVRDSSGVTIAQSSGPSWKSDLRWTLRDEPLIQIGVGYGDTHYQFFRVSAACWLAGGRIAVANAGSSTLRFFDLEGTFLREVGGVGDGPGEFRRLTSLERYGTDSLVAFDADLRRISIFSADGDIARTIRLRQPGPEPLYAAFPLSRGDFVVRALSTMVDPGVTPGRYRTTAPILRYGADGALLDTVGLFPGSELSVSEVGRGMAFGWAPFGRTTAVDVRNDLVYVGTAEDLEIQVYSPGGDLKQLVRGPKYRHPIAQEDIERHLEPFLEGIDDLSAREWMEKLLSEMEYPDYWPPYSEVLVDPSGNIWVAYYPEVARQPSSRWMVFSSSGQLLGDLDLPERMTVLDITSEFMIGVWTDDFDVEYIRVYELTKG
jgi:hypothetical protein